jgi:hypothetical protein
VKLKDLSPEERRPVVKRINHTAPETHDERHDQI